MKLLITTQVVDRDDPLLGFFHSWITAFAKQCEEVTVVCLKEGMHDLPANVRVLSLGKERGRVSRVRYALRFWKIIWQERTHYTDVFVHMNHEYIVLGGLLWRLLHRPIIFWYVHKQVTWKLRFATWCANYITTATAETFPLSTPKLRVVGHGIDTTFFSPAASVKKDTSLKLLSVGRLSSTKRHERVVEVCAELGPPAELSIVGAAAARGDAVYEKSLRGLVSELGLSTRVHFLGARTQHQMRDIYHAADMLVHTSQTGGMDKVVLEALACGLPVVTTSTVFAQGELPAHFVSDDSPESVARVIRAVMAAPYDAISLSAPVCRLHSVEHCTGQILSLYAHTS